MDESIKLDRKSFEALAGQTRVKALKSLLRRRKTLTELSDELQLSPSTMKEHLDVLVDSELITQVDEGRKWKYYELTRKGKQIAEPHELRVWIILGLSIVAAAAAIFNLLYAFQSPAQPNFMMAEAAPSGEGGLMLGATAPEPQAAPTAGESAAATAERDMVAAGVAAESSPEEATASAEMQEKSASLEDVQPTLPFMQVGIAAAAVLILTWAAFYARGEGVL
jgi:DNA-binding transcriptional ArsR family regulator